MAMRENVQRGKEPLQGMFPDVADIFTQIDYNKSTRRCFYPQVELLNEIHAAYPHATFVLNRRNVTDWVSSVTRWRDMHRRIARCNITGFPAPSAGTSLDERLEMFYEEHIRRVRDFAERHPSHRLIDFDIYSENAGRMLHDAFGIDEGCWGQRNANPPKIKL
eukprot:CAMPEP_0113555800 /NCGR_PEP_ID=MMETSP0015_2-20120614/16914_1 /TAXON_ID=2838 /ORGANISM="Odontella" /LENGTH=162 /DNA_ID=CAMNT_0000457109 /DNA_START=515 /DNA_END=1003 /DNA_ORIENTATION=+ /assembly_acc=CAM_ASM_000160